MSSAKVLVITLVNDDPDEALRQLLIREIPARR
jgi:hypothetical protein